MSTITVSVTGLAGERKVTVESGSTIADVREAADIAASLAIRTDGQTVQNEAAQLVRDEQVFVTTPPDSKHGS